MASILLPWLCLIYCYDDGWTKYTLDWSGKVVFDGIYSVFMCFIRIVIRTLSKRLLHTIPEMLLQDWAYWVLIGNVRQPTQ